MSIKHLAVFLVMLFPLIEAAAQKPCSTSNICGKWRLCGSTISGDYDHPPAAVNADSLVKALYPYNSLNSSWEFGADGNYKWITTYDGVSKGRFHVVESNCDLVLSSRKRHPIRIVHLSDSALITWHNNPKTALLTLYRR